MDVTQEPDHVLEYVAHFDKRAQLELIRRREQEQKSDD